VHGSISKGTSFGNSWLEKTNNRKLLGFDSEYIYMCVCVCVCVCVKYFDKQSLDRPLQGKNPSYCP